MYTTFISVHELEEHLSDDRWLVVDCRFDLANPNWGEDAYKVSHLPGALYAHLDRHLSGKVIKGKTGRHPLPPVDELSRTFGEWGVGEGVQVIAYDSWPFTGGENAGRLWWLLRWLGHETVAVLDGGWNAWLEAGNPVDRNLPSPKSGVFIPKMRADECVSAEEVNHLRQDEAYRLLDSRSADRYRGENETIDPVAGHIPGAISLPFADSFTPEGKILPQEKLREHFAAVLDHVPAHKAIFYCGSGVTAAVNLLALAHAGLGRGRLYAGSWSEWITDPGRAISTSFPGEKKPS